MHKLNGRATDHHGKVRLFKTDVGDISKMIATTMSKRTSASPDKKLRAKEQLIKELQSKLADCEARIVAAESNSKVPTCLLYSTFKTLDC
jgi:peptidoglycan hydrolase CwlO-like protein